MALVKSLKRKSDDMRVYFEKLANEDAERARYLEKLAEDTRDLLAIQSPIWSAAEKVDETEATEVISPSLRNERIKQALLSLPNPYGWMAAEYPDDVSRYQGFGAPFNVETPSDLVDAGPAKLEIAEQQQKTDVIQKSVQRSARRLTRNVSIQNPGLDALVGKSSIPGACGTDVAANLVTFDVTAEEAFTFFARHYRWHGFMIRFVKNGWNTQSIANYINWARDLKGKEVFRTGNLDMAIRLHQIKVAAENRTGELRLSPSQWGANHQRALVDIALADLADRVVNWPTGHGCGPLTRCIQYAIAHPEQRLTLRDTDRIVREQDFQLLQRQMGANLDEAALLRFDMSDNNVQRDHRG